MTHSRTVLTLKLNKPKHEKMQVISKNYVFIFQFQFKNIFIVIPYTKIHIHGKTLTVVLNSQLHI